MVAISKALDQNLTAQMALYLVESIKDSLSYVPVYEVGETVRFKRTPELTSKLNLFMSRSEVEKFYDWSFSSDEMTLQLELISVIREIFNIPFLIARFLVETFEDSVDII